MNQTQIKGKDTIGKSQKDIEFLLERALKSGGRDSRGGRGGNRSRNRSGGNRDRNRSGGNRDRNRSSGDRSRSGGDRDSRGRR